MTDLVANVVFEPSDEMIADYVRANAENGGCRLDGDSFWFDVNGYWDVSENLDGETAGPLFVMYGAVGGGGVTVFAPDCGSRSVRDVDDLERRIESSFGSGATIDDYSESPLDSGAREYAIRTAFATGTPISNPRNLDVGAILTADLAENYDDDPVETTLFVARTLLESMTVADERDEARRRIREEVLHRGL